MPIPLDEQSHVASILVDFCERRVPPGIRDQVELLFRFEGQAVLLFEKRPAWRLPGQWVELYVAKFRYYVGRKEWELYCRDRNQRWHRYDLVPPTPKFERLLSEVERDPTCIFWG